MERVILTKEGYEKMVQELNFLQTKKRREVADMLEKARAHGDLRENAEYDAAKLAKQQLESRIAVMQDRVSRAEIVEMSDVPTDKALLGMTIDIRNEESEETFQYTLVSQDEADFSAGKISITSPIGKGILGKIVDEIAEIQIPAGTIHLRILKIFRQEA